MEQVIHYCIWLLSHKKHQINFGKVTLAYIKFWASCHDQIRSKVKNIPIT